MLEHSASKQMLYFHEIIAMKLATYVKPIEFTSIFLEGFFLFIYFFFAYKPLETTWAPPLLSVWINKKTLRAKFYA